MRQLLIQVPRGRGKEAIEIAKASAGVNLLLFEARDGDGAIDSVIIHLSNAKVEGFLKQLETVGTARVTLNPHGVMALHPPASETPEQVTQVSDRSPIEVFLAGLQSIGSWQGFLSYALISGVIVWVGLFTNNIYLLVAAMLIAPFSGPAMNTAIATARGDRTLLRSSILRYFSALGLTILVAGLLSFLFQQESATQSMTSNSQISVVSALLPLAAGAAGALQLTQSERSSLVSGAATGMLVAASLAPPAGIVGMAAAIGRWEMVQNGIFLLLLQLAGINLSAAIVLRRNGLSTRGARYDRGKNWVFPVVLGATAAGLSGLLTWQLANPPALQRSSREQRAANEIQKAIAQYQEVKLVEANVRFTRPEIEGQNTLLCVVYVQRLPNAMGDDVALRDRLTRQIQFHLLQQGFNVTPLVSVIMLKAPSTT